MVSSQCKFELKANVDRVQREKGISRTQAIAEVAADLDLHIETARTQDKRARKELGQIEPIKSNQVEKPVSSEIEAPKLTKAGGKREGAGRPKTNNIEAAEENKGTPTWALDFAASAISQLKRIEDDDPRRDKAFNRVADWITKQQILAADTDEKKMEACFWVAVGLAKKLSPNFQKQLIEILTA